MLFRSVTTLPERLEKAGIPTGDRARIIAEATTLVQREVIPGYERMIALFENMRPTANHDAGIWRLPKGEAIYAAARKSNTTTDLSANEIHELGVAEVDRIEKEMVAILDAEGVAGTTLAALSDRPREAGDAVRVIVRPRRVEFQPTSDLPAGADATVVPIDVTSSIYRGNDWELVGTALIGELRIVTAVAPAAKRGFARLTAADCRCVDP